MEKLFNIFSYFKKSKRDHLRSVSFKGEIVAEGELSNFEKKVIKKVLKSTYPDVDGYVKNLKVSNRRNTEVGFFTDLKDENEPLLGVQKRLLSKFTVEINDEFNTGYIVFMEGGRVATIEGYINGEGPWPKYITSASFDYS